MKTMVTVVPLLVALIMGARPGEASTHATVASVSTFLEDHASDFLDHVKGHFDKSLNYLFTGNAFGDQSIQRPGLAKVLKEESDRHWNLGIDALKKYLQRGGKTPATPQPIQDANGLNAAGKPNRQKGRKAPTTPQPIQDANGQKAARKLDQEVVFKNKFVFHGNNSLITVEKGSPDFASTYLLQCAKLVTDCKTTVVQMNDLHRMSMHRAEGNHGEFDAEMGHYLEEKLEKEVGLMRKFSNLHTSLEKMSNLGLAQHIFDKRLSD